MNEEIEKSTKERVKDITTINFSITKCPTRVYEEFVAFCKRETNDNYSMGLKLMTESVKSNIKEVVLFEQYMELKQELSELKDEVEELKAEVAGKSDVGSAKTFS